MSRVQRGLLIFAFVLLTVEVARADPPFTPPGPPFNPPGPPSWAPPGRSVPIPATDLLFGAGLAALAWWGTRTKKQ